MNLFGKAAVLGHMGRARRLGEIASGETKVYDNVRPAKYSFQADPRDEIKMSLPLLIAPLPANLSRVFVGLYALNVPVERVYLDQSPYPFDLNDDAIHVAYETTRATCGTTLPYSIAMAVVDQLGCDKLVDRECAAWTNNVASALGLYDERREAFLKVVHRITTRLVITPAFDEATNAVSENLRNGCVNMAGIRDQLAIALPMAFREFQLGTTINHRNVSEAAYYLWVHSGRIDGFDRQQWFAAEKGLRFASTLNMIWMAIEPELLHEIMPTDISLVTNYRESRSVTLPQ